MSELLKISDVALILNLSEITLRRLIKRQGIPVHRVGKSYRFSKEDLHTYLSNTAIPMRGNNENS